MLAQDGGESVRIGARECGGWIAYSTGKRGLRVGVLADTEEAAAIKYRETVERWRQILGGREGMDAGL